jgi:hypothetical protein
MVLCVAPDRQALGALKRAAVSAEWELTPGAITEEDALAQLESERPQVLVAFGDLEDLVARAREAWPYLRIICDRDLPGASLVVSAPGEVRDAVKGLPRPGGPVR